MCAKALGNLGFIKRTCGTMNHEYLKVLYFALVRSVIKFGSAIWNPMKIGQIDKID